MPWLARVSALQMILLVAVATLFSGCATYTPLPLGSGEGADSVAQLVAPIAAMPPPVLASHRFDPADGLDVTEVAMLAVANSPLLKVKRDALGVARAQAFAAGLLPDPQVSLGEDFPRDPTAGLTTAFNLGLSEDVSALLTRSSRVAVARSQADQVNLDLLWAEWQTVTQARVLFDQVSSLRAQAERLQAEQVALTPLQHDIQAALHAGNLTYDSASVGLAAVADLRQQLAGNAVALHQATSDLHVLLGLAPTAPLHLVGAPYHVVPNRAEVQQALQDLPVRRPDLLALQAGYQSQQAALRAAVRAQFPALSIGFNTARDTSAVYSNGFSIGITLPLFNRNRGNIAIAQATRQQLHDDYAARLLATRSDMQRLLADLATLKQQASTSTQHARELDAALHAAQLAWQQGRLDWPTYLAIRGNALKADLEQISVRQQQALQSIALQSLLGNTDLDTTHPVTAKASKP